MLVFHFHVIEPLYSDITLLTNCNGARHEQLHEAIPKDLSSTYTGYSERVCRSVNERFMHWGCTWRGLFVDLESTLTHEPTKRLMHIAMIEVLNAEYVLLKTYMLLEPHQTCSP